MAGRRPSGVRLRRAAISGASGLGRDVLVMGPLCRAGRAGTACVHREVTRAGRAPRRPPGPAGWEGDRWARRVAGRRLTVMSTHAKRERLLMADLLETAGPEAPTLCEGWRTRDLAAHVVVRERRPDAAGGMLVKQLAPRLERVMAEFTAKPYEELIQLIRTGPPRFSPFDLKQV